MNVNDWMRRGGWFISATLMIALFAGCPGSSSVEPNPPGIKTTRTLIVTDGRLPVWVNDNSFVFNYSTENGTDGIFLSDLEGNPTQVFDGPHNHDYSVSPDGGWITFSTPEIGGGVWAVQLTNPPSEPVLVLANGRRPAWLSSGIVLAENQTGDFGVIEVANPGEFTEYGIGSYPVASGTGQFIAYLFSSPSAGFDLRYLDRNTEDNELLGTMMATDHVWNPMHDVVYGSRLTDNTLTDIVELDIAQLGEFTTLLSGATRPSVSRDGVNLFADRVVAGVNQGIYYYNLDTGRKEIIADAQRPAAASSGTELLAEQSDGIFLIEFD